MQPTSAFCHGRWITTQARVLCHHTGRRSPLEVALYVRVSTTRPQQTQTIAPQLARLRAHVATQPDWHLAEEPIDRDDGYSGAKLNRPGLDRRRDRAALAACARVLLTAPDRLARNDVHQRLLIEELAQRGCEVAFLDRPMSPDPHEQLLLQIRGAVAAYERTLITDRRRRGRQAKWRRGQLLPWSVPPTGLSWIPIAHVIPSACGSIRSKPRGSPRSVRGLPPPRRRPPSMAWLSV